MPSTATDLRYGRRGGGWLPRGYVPAVECADTPRCKACDGPMLVESGDYHAGCQPVDVEMFPDV